MLFLFLQGRGSYWNRRVRRCKLEEGHQGLWRLERGREAS